MKRSSNRSLGLAMPGLKGRLTWRQQKTIEMLMDEADTYLDWSELAKKYDDLNGMDKWKSNPKSSLYDSSEVQRRFEKLEWLLKKGDVHELLFNLNEGIHGNMGGMGNSALYSQSKLGTKHLITDYVNSIAKAIDCVGEASDAEVSNDEKRDFFRRAGHCYGHSALMLSGASGLIYFHHGVVASLIENDLLPNVFAGSSAGAWISAQLGTRNDEELNSTHFRNFRYPAMETDSVLGWLYGSNLESRDEFRAEMIDSFAPDMTFQEAFEHSGRYINVSVSPADTKQKPRLLNAMASPNVTLRSALMATSAVPGIVPSVKLEAKNSNGKVVPYLPTRRWIDGAVRQDLPFQQVSRLYGVNYYLVSLANPLALPVLSMPGTKKNLVLKTISATMKYTLKEFMDSGEKALANYQSLKYPHFMMQNINSILHQQYTGDVNFILGRQHYDHRNLVFHYLKEQPERLIKEGEKSTWPKLDQLKNATLIGKKIHKWLKRIDGAGDHIITL